jgi:hypothetical protein
MIDIFTKFKSQKKNIFSLSLSLSPFKFNFYYWIKFDQLLLFTLSKEKKKHDIMYCCKGS